MLMIAGKQLARWPAHVVDHPALGLDLSPKSSQHCGSRDSLELDASGG
jgi:hypothetical protein